MSELLLVYCYNIEHQIASYNDGTEVTLCPEMRQLHLISSSSSFNFTNFNRDSNILQCLGVHYSAMRMQTQTNLPHV